MLAEEEVVRFDASWLRFAPFTGSGLVIAAAGIGVPTQVAQTGVFDRLDPSAVVDSFPTLPLVVVVPVVVVLSLVLVTLLSIAGYLVTNWDLRLTRTRTAPRSWHLTRGLFTTRETTIDDDRLAGVSLVEPIGVRLARGARLSSIVTGLDRNHQGSSVLVPPAPRAVVGRVADAVLATPDR